MTPHSIEEEMLGKLRFKTSMFEGVLDDGEDSIFISDDKFTKMMEAVSGIMEEVKTENKEDWTNQDITEEGEEKNNKANTPEVKAEPDKAKDISSIAPHSATTVTHRPAEPKDLVAQGVSFLSGLAETLKSPEATAQLVDSIIEKDEQTGETSIKIPVESKETVSNLLNLIGKLFAK